VAFFWVLPFILSDGICKWKFYPGAEKRAPQGGHSLHSPWEGAGGHVVECGSQLSRLFLVNSGFFDTFPLGGFVFIFLVL